MATPERLDAITRNPEHGAWISSVGALVVDEAHLLGDPRGVQHWNSLSHRCSYEGSAANRAPLGNDPVTAELLREWLRPCQIVTSTVRTPLAKEVWELSA